MSLSLKIPAIKDKFYPDYVVPQIKDKIDNTIRANYGDIVDKISSLTGVNSELIESFIFIESAGNPKAETPYAVGLMQVSKAAASDAIVFEKGSGRLKQGEYNLLKKYLGERIKLIDKVKPNQKSLGKTFITKEDLLKPEFNILVGSIILGQLINEFTEKGKVRLDKVVVVYNTGRYAKPSKIAIAHKGTTQDLLTKIPKGQGDYVRKLLGTNGTLDVIV